MASGPTYTPLATQTLGSATATVTFSSIPSTYTDLIVECVVGLTAGDDILLRFNGDSSSIYSSTRLAGNGTAASSSRTTGYTGIQPRTPANQASTVTTTWRINVMNYANTTTYKTAISRYDYVGGFTETDVGLWRSTAAISSLSVLCQASTFVTGSTFTLYGIASA